MIRYLLIGLLGYLFIGLFLPIANGQTMSNENYKIKMQEFNSISGTTTNTDYTVRSTVGELSPVLSEGVNFKVRTGFENIASTLPFSASLSSDIIDFGTLSPTNPIVRTVDLSVYSLSSYGYSVVAFEDHPLQSDPDASGQVIADTTCDNGDCGEEKAGIWINMLTYGFGYRCDNITGTDCDKSFLNPKFYKHFADNSNGQSPQSVMSGIGSKNKSSTDSVLDKDIRMSYKVNIAGGQGQGIYSNIVTYIAIPNF